MRVKKAEYVKDYKIKINFNDEVVKIVDFKSFLKDAKNLLIPLLDIAYFKNFSVDDTTICWPNEVDFCPDVLYDAGQEVKNPKPKQISAPTRRKNKSSTVWLSN
jgi:hypothetical protein